MPSGNLYGKEEDKEEWSCNPSPAIDTSRVCDEMLSYEEGGDNPQINTFFNFLPSGISLHEGGMCLLGPIEEKEDIHPEEHEEDEALVAEILSERMDVSLENDPMGPLLGPYKY